jgi:hypothetical protein
VAGEVALDVNGGTGQELGEVGGVEGSESMGTSSMARSVLPIGGPSGDGLVSAHTLAWDRQAVDGPTSENAC